MMKKFSRVFVLLFVFVSLFSSFVPTQAASVGTFVESSSDKLFVEEDYNYAPGSVYNPLNTPKAYA